MFRKCLLIVIIILFTGAGIIPAITGIINLESVETTDVVITKTLPPHPIYGTATWDGGGNADGASVEVTSSLGTLTTTVGPDGGWGSGEWQVDCGDPGPNWPEGTSFTVTITGSEAHAGWSGNASGSVSGYYDDMGIIVVYEIPSSRAPTAYIDSITPNPAEEAESVSFEGHGTDSDGTIVGYYWRSNKDGELSIQASFSSSSMSAGTHTIYFKVKDDDGYWSSEDSENLIIQGVGNKAPETPSIIGPTSGKTGTMCEYTFFSEDPDGDKISYFIDWGDDTSTGWTEFVASGTSVNVEHTWNEKGNYVIKAKTKDIHGKESDWGNLEVSIPKNLQPRNTVFLYILERIMERFPWLEQVFSLFPIFDRLFGFI